MNGIFKESTLITIGKIKKGFLWAAVCLLIGIFVMGAFLILANNYDIVFGKFIATISIFTLVLFVGVNNFIRMEKGTKLVQILALAGLISGIVAAILGVLLIWEVVPVMEFFTEPAYCPSGKWNTSCELMAVSGPSIALKIASVFTSLAGAGFWLSNVLSIKETVKVVKPLKITSVACETYCSLFAVVAVFIVEVPSNLGMLSGFMGFAFVVTALAAWIISRTNRNKQVAVNGAPGAASVSQPVVSKTDEELRAEIEEKVRREMIEKEVRAKMEREQKGDLGDGDSGSNNL
ncbi:hypothetical protein IKG24_02060 [Candidatus Saccharibacteria bacterium]|nr:hypothetical protein [Candidatus Saccharibacteria bacterium]